MTVSRNDSQVTGKIRTWRVLVQGTQWQKFGIFNLDTATAFHHPVGSRYFGTGLARMIVPASNYFQ